MYSSARYEFLPGFCRGMNEAFAKVQVLGTVLVPVTVQCSVTEYSTCIFIIIYILPVQVNKCVLYPRGTDCVEVNMASTAMMALAAASEARMVADETPLKNQFLAF